MKKHLHVRNDIQLVERGPRFKMAGGGRYLGLLLRYRHNINNQYFSHSSIRNSVTNTSDRNYYLRNDHSYRDCVVHALHEHLKRSSSTYIFHNNAPLLSISQTCKIARCSFLRQSFVRLSMADLAATDVDHVG